MPTDQMTRLSPTHQISQARGPDYRSIVRRYHQNIFRWSGRWNNIEGKSCNHLLLVCNWSVQKVIFHLFTTILEQIHLINSLSDQTSLFLGSQNWATKFITVYITERSIPFTPTFSSFFSLEDLLSSPRTFWSTPYPSSRYRHSFSKFYGHLALDFCSIISTATRPCDSSIYWTSTSGLLLLATLDEFLFADYS